MMKTIAAGLAIATIAASLAPVAPAQAGNGSVAAGVAAGLIGGAIVGGAIASSRPAYAYPAPVYVEPAPPPVPPGCYWQQQRYWDGYGWVFHPVRVCY
jgi:hypothetical protein